MGYHNASATSDVCEDCPSSTRSRSLDGASSLRASAPTAPKATGRFRGLAKAKSSPNHFSTSSWYAERRCCPRRLTSANNEFRASVKSALASATACWFTDGELINARRAKSRRRHALPFGREQWFRPGLPTPCHHRCGRFARQQQWHQSPHPHRHRQR